MARRLLVLKSEINSAFKSEPEATAARPARD